MEKYVLGSIYTDASDDFQKGILPIARCIKAEKHDLGVVIMQVRKLGNIYGFEGGNYAGNVYDKEMLSPAIQTCQGGNQQPMIVAMRGRNPDNPSDRTAGILTEQRLELNSQGICNTLTGVQKDNMVLENAVTTQGNEISGTIRACIYKCGLANVERNCEMGSGFGYEGVIESTCRIRKLIPIECWRLMSFSDEDFYKAENVNSNSRLYMQAGNSLVKVIMMAILSQLNIKGVKPWDEMIEKERNDIIGRN